MGTKPGTKVRSAGYGKPNIPIHQFIYQLRVFEKGYTVKFRTHTKKNEDDLAYGAYHSDMMSKETDVSLPCFLEQ